jgi:hypothetical protein
MSNEELEENGLMEVCKHCNSLHVTIEPNGDKYCNSCGIVNFTEVVTEEAWVEKDSKINKINC